MLTFLHVPIRATSLLHAVAALLLGLVFVGACDQTATPTFETDIAPVIAKRCTGCHVPGGIAPFPLTTYGDVFAQRHAVANQVVNGWMPPWHAESGHKTYKGDPSLTATEKEVIAQWARHADGDALELSQAVGVIAESPNLDPVDVTVALEQAYTPMSMPDDYRCFVLEWPLQQTVYVSAVNVKPSNPEIAHHAIAYLAYPEGATFAVANDAADPEPGYDCFGGPGRIGIEEYDYGSVGGWVPGYGPNKFPDGTGIKIEPGSAIVLQMHYNVLSSNPASDRTEISFQIVDTVEREGFYIAWLNGFWTLPGRMPIPADTWTTHEFISDPYFYFPLFSNVPVTSRRPFRIYSAIAHMHERGVTAEVFINREDRADNEMLLRIPNWDFNWQREYTFATPITFDPGDQLGVRCHFDNTATHQPIRNGTQVVPRDLSWGEGTDDEMCIAFMYTTVD